MKKKIVLKFSSRSPSARFFAIDTVTFFYSFFLVYWSIYRVFVSFFFVINKIMVFSACVYNVHLIIIVVGIIIIKRAKIASV